MTDSPIRSWIRFWLKRNDREFEEEAAAAAAMPDVGIPQDILDMCARHDLNIHQRNQFPVGAYLDSIDPDKHGGRKADAEKLFTVAEVGADLFLQAIHVADDEDNAGFFVEAYGRWGPLVDAVLTNCDLPDRDTMTGRVRRSDE